MAEEKGKERKYSVSVMHATGKSTATLTSLSAVLALGLSQLAM